jgi:arginine-tRNA-protein transferase
LASREQKEEACVSSDVAGATFCHYPSWPPPLAVPLVTVSQPCVYLPGRLDCSRAFMAASVAAEVYEAFMDAGFRRSGKVIYQPACSGCRECRPIRVPVQRFIPNKSQRRCLRKNADLLVLESPLLATDEKFELYSRYVRFWHGKTEATDRADFERFLYDSPVNSLEFSYRDATGRLLGVGICDLGPRTLSSVYFYFEPTESRRGMGTFGALHEIAYATIWDIGYAIAPACPTRRIIAPANSSTPTASGVLSSRSLIRPQLHEERSSVGRPGSAAETKATIIGTAANRFVDSQRSRLRV